MRTSSSIRLTFLVVKELARKYTRSLLLGFFVGLALSLIFGKVYPWILGSLFRPMERIGVVGEFTPSDLPLPIQELISSGLTDLSHDGTPVPALASHWEATNSGKTFIFTLRDDWQWHDDKYVSAHDINYNIRGVTLIPSGDNTLTAYLQYPYSPFPTLISKPIFLPGLVGMGRYSVQQTQLSGGNVKSIVLYPRQPSNDKPKRYTFYKTETLAILAFKLGEIDRIQELSAPSGLGNWGGVAVEEKTKYDRIVALFFNVRNPELADKSVRQGLAFGIPELPYEEAPSPISKVSWAFSSNVKKYPYNEKEAKRLLSNTTLATGSAELTLSTFPTYLEVAQKIAASWTELGIRTKVQVENSVPENYQVLLSAHDVPPDPDQYPFWHSTQPGTNITGYANVKIDKLLEDGRIELDQAKRKQIYTDFQRYLVDDVPAVFLYYPTMYSVVRGK